MSKLKLTTLKKIFEDLEVANNIIETYGISSTRYYLVHNGIKFAKFDELLRYYMWNNGIEKDLKNSIKTNMEKAKIEEKQKNEKDYFITLDCFDYIGILEFYIFEYSTTSYNYDKETIHKKIANEFDTIILY